MAENAMFSDIKKFNDLEFFENHKGGKLYVADGVYNIQIYTYNVLNSNKDIAYRTEQYKNGKNASLINNFENNYIHKNELKINATDKFILLSTCHGVGTPERATLFCKIEKIEGSSNINEESDSTIGKDEKKKDQEEQEKQREKEKSQILQELKRKDNKKYEKDWFEKVKEFFEELWNNPQRLILYILIFITCIIYILILVKKFKEKKNGKTIRSKNIKNDSNKKINKHNKKNNHANILKVSNKNGEQNNTTKTRAKSRGIYNSRVEEKNIARIKEMLSNGYIEEISTSKTTYANPKSKNAIKNEKHIRASKKKKGKHSK